MIQGADSPLILCTVTKYKVMKISDIIDAIDGEIVARGLYLVDVSVSRDNDIEVTIEAGGLRGDKPSLRDMLRP